ncbi:HD domain-containing protein [bacterium]|nr:HD domain-containing protein [bacterium]
MRHDYDYDFRQGINKRNEELSTAELLQIIFDYVGRIARERSLEKVLMMMADMGREIVVADRCTVWMLDKKTHELWAKVAHGIPDIRIPRSFGIVGEAISSGKSIIINDAYNHPKFDKQVDVQTGYKTENILVIPIQNSEGTTIGAYQAINKMTPAGAFSEDDEERLLLASSYTGHVLESIMLYEEIENTQKEMIYALSEAGETRSHETGNHVKRVAEYSGILASGYGLDKKEVEMIITASPLHDIGKIGIPDSILLKPDHLTALEHQIIQQHTTQGYNMLNYSPRPILQTSATIAHEHHEKWNGTGYPRGLKKENIHIYGRITAIADVFDALGSDRVYKKAWPLDRILILFKEEQGGHFDPALVDIFFDRLDLLIEVRDRFKDTFSDEMHINLMN